MYKIASCSLKVNAIEKTLNKYAKEGYKFVTMFNGSFLFFQRMYLIFER